MLTPYFTTEAIHLINEADRWQCRLWATTAAKSSALTWRWYEPYYKDEDTAELGHCWASEVLGGKISQDKFVDTDTPLINMSTRWPGKYNSDPSFGRCHVSNCEQ